MRTDSVYKQNRLIKLSFSALYAKNAHTHTHTHMKQQVNLSCVYKCCQHTDMSALQLHTIQFSFTLYIYIAH